MCRLSIDHESFKRLLALNQELQIFKTERAFVCKRSFLVQHLAGW